MISNNAVVLKMHSLYTTTERHTYRAGIAAVCSVCHWNDWSLLAQESKVMMHILLLRLWLLVKPILIEIVCQSWKCVKRYLWEEEGEQSVHAPCLLNHSIILPAGQRDYAANCPATSQVEHRRPNLCKWHSGYLRSFAKLFFLKERPGKYCASEFTGCTRQMQFWFTFLSLLLLHYYSFTLTSLLPFSRPTL